MTPEKILELAARNEINPHSEFRWSFDEEDLIAFAQSILEAERESSDEPVAWQGWDKCGMMKFRFKAFDGAIPLYRHPPSARNLTDEEIIECSQKASRLFLKQQASARGMQLTVQDSFDWHFAKVIERRINGEEE